jgi:hypothetical protein
VACRKWAIPIVCASFIIRNSSCKRLQITDTVLVWLRIKLFKNFAYGCLQGHLPVELQHNFVLRRKNDSEYAYCISVYFQLSFYAIHPSGARCRCIDIIWRGARRLYFVMPWNQPEVVVPLSYLKLAQTALICVGVFIQHWQYAHSLLQLFLMATSAQRKKKTARISDRRRCHQSLLFVWFWQYNTRGFCLHQTPVSGRETMAKKKAFLTTCVGFEVPL